MSGIPFKTEGIYARIYDPKDEWEGFEETKLSKIFRVATGKIASPLHFEIIVFQQTLESRSYLSDSDIKDPEYCVFHHHDEGSDIFSIADYTNPHSIGNRQLRWREAHKITEINNNLVAYNRRDNNDVYSTCLFWQDFLTFKMENRATGRKKEVGDFRYIPWT
ncbi:MAG: hypothetical protein H8E55_41760 [Pelagibacterales bacterium]|nr:hypothetical protein [Pelagibacterales bacterium]